MNKQFGQNFLLPQAIRKRIVDALEPSAGLTIWEIGPGLGALTVLLLEKKCQLTAFEIDKGFCSILREKAFADETGFRLVEGDFLKTWEAVYGSGGVPHRICGNLPYNVGSVCIARLLERQCLPDIMVFTVQKEVAERLTSRDGDKNRSTLTLLADIDYETRLLFTIGGGAFYPSPDVTSAAVGMYRRATPLVDAALRPVYLSLVKDAFSHRRKTMKNNLLQGEIGNTLGKDGVDAILANSGVNPQSRAEALSFEELKALAVAAFNRSR
ncbi:16S rRNA (adenine(1518)-N(6)/adenine(1519)-N(6))-dimethyltransferase RsmA [Parasphaerochaeta coccoides]|nr:16S rRNA (adenine(1518)-N(6)/adenine(1519)-N(6))-dimethyltransferase RsmA [Parasphaerochaeta coccoides]